MRLTRGGSADRLETAAFDERDAAAAAYSVVLEHLEPAALRAESARVREELREHDVVFGGSEPHPFDVDVVPRLIASADWSALEKGLIQRVRALNEFIADVYSERRIVAAGVVPSRLIEEADWYEPAMSAGAGADQATIAAQLAGPDLVRGPDGRFRVLEDNLRAPSGLGYLLAARMALEPIARACDLEPKPIEPAIAALGSAILGTAPDGIEAPTVVLLNDGPCSSAAYEHAELARWIGMTIATADDLSRDGDRLLLEGEIPVDVIYRRVDDERLTAADGSRTRLGELLIEPLRAGTLGCANSPGTGIADDKAVHVYVERIIEFYLGEEPLLSSVRGYDLGDPEQLERVRADLGELVIKPRSDFGGTGVMIGPLAGPEERRAKLEQVLAAPDRFVAQEPVPLSVHPTAVGGSLRNRHVDLRPFVISDGESITVAAGGLTRFARAEGEMVVNSGRGGGAKDTWVL